MRERALVKNRNGSKKVLLTNCLFRFCSAKKCLAVVATVVCCCKQEDDPDRRVVENFITTCFFSTKKNPYSVTS